MFRFRRLRAAREGWRQVWRGRRLPPGLARAIRRRRARLRLAPTGGGGFHPEPVSRTSLVCGLALVVLLALAVMMTASLRPRVVARPLVPVEQTAPAASAR